MTDGSQFETKSTGKEGEVLRLKLTQSHIQLGLVENKN